MKIWSNGEGDEADLERLITARTSSGTIKSTSNFTSGRLGAGIQSGFSNSCRTEETESFFLRELWSNLASCSVVKELTCKLSCS